MNHPHHRHHNRRQRPRSTTRPPPRRSSRKSTNDEGFREVAEMTPSRQRAHSILAATRDAPNAKRR